MDVRTHLGEDLFLRGMWPGFLVQGRPALNQHRLLCSGLSLLYLLPGLCVSTEDSLHPRRNKASVLHRKYFTEEMKVNWYPQVSVHVPWAAAMRVHRVVSGARHWDTGLLAKSS